MTVACPFWRCEARCLEWGYFLARRPATLSDDEVADDSHTTLLQGVAGSEDWGALCQFHSP